MNNLKELRKKNNLERKEIAKVLNITEEEYLKLENNQKNLLDYQLIQLSNYYKVSIDYLLGLTKETKLYPKRKV